MRKPKSPPTVSEVFDFFSDHTQRFLEISREVQGPTVKKKYLHWDELLRRNPPGDYSHKEWWSVLKFKRIDAYRFVPLEGTRHNGRFKYVDTDPIPELLHRFDLECGGQIQMPEQITNDETRDRYYVSSLIEEAITSSQLEGAATTREVAKEMIRSGAKPRDRSERMILNNFVTMQRVGELKNEPFTKERVFEIHRLVTENTLNDDSAAGRFRTKADGPIVVGDDQGEIFHVPPPPDELDARMEMMCKFANDEAGEPFVHPVIRSIILHFWLAYDHPFVDGNGRTARALFYWSMIHHGYCLFEFISISKIILTGPSKYVRAFLQTETDDNDLTYFILYHMEIIRRSIEELYEYIRRKTVQLKDLERKLRAVARLNHRQKAIIMHALKHPHQIYTFDSHKRSHNIAYQTARTDILNLLDQGYLESAGTQGRTHNFIPVKDLGQQLENAS